MAKPPHSPYRRLIGVLRLVARLRPRHLPLLPLAATVVLTDSIFRLAPRPRFGPAPATPLDWGSGVSVIIPERAAPAMLAQCLAHLERAATAVAEPVEVVVVVNGSPLADYADLAARHPQVRWLHSAEPLGFTSAVLRGLEVVGRGATYLLNNDMLLEPDALVAALALRAADVFAVASQIHFPDGRRREETGWTSLTTVAGVPVVRHETPIDDAVRGAAWAGAGSGLFHTGLLRQLLPGARPFDPFYWEDVDVGTRAWRAGYLSLFCPGSIAWHRHRATVARLYDADEVERIFERNRWLFALRQPFPRPRLSETLRGVAGLPPASQRELGSWPACRALWWARFDAWRAPFRDVATATQWTLRLGRPQPESPRPQPPQPQLPGVHAHESGWSQDERRRPTIVIVSPYAVLPPRHGGAVRTVRLAATLAEDHDVVLLSDERDLYPPPDPAGWTPFAAAHLVATRRDDRDLPAGDRIGRIRSHSTPELAATLARVIALHGPHAVIVSHAELAGVGPDARRRLPPGLPPPPFVLDLHDVLLCPDDPAAARADRFELDLIRRSDRVLVCSPEDQALLGTLPSCLVGNGFDPRLPSRYRPSTGLRNILFVGPFRAPNNWAGIRDFVVDVYPGIVRRVPDVTLTIVGGEGAAERVREVAGFASPSIRVIDTVDDVTPLLAACALTINPQAELRGSSLKVIDALAAGRICITTRAGGRGFLDVGFAGLVAVDGLADFAEPLAGLLADDARRGVLEAPDPVRLARCSWTAAGTALRTMLADLGGAPPRCDS